MENKNYEQSAMVDVAKTILLESKEALLLNDIIKEVANRKGFSINNISKVNQLYTDMTFSAEFVYVGKNLWDLKERNLSFWDKDGTSFSSESNLEDLESFDDDQEDLDFTDYEGFDDLDDYPEEDFEEEDFEGLDEEEILSLKEEKEYIDNETPYIDSDQDDDKDFDLDDVDSKYDDEEDDYNKYMDDYEDLYE